MVTRAVRASAPNCSVGLGKRLILSNMHIDGYALVASMLDLPKTRMEDLNYVHTIEQM
jgi:hypothetical protein